MNIDPGNALDVTTLATEAPSTGADRRGCIGISFPDDQVKAAISEVLAPDGNWHIYADKEGLHVQQCNMSQGSMKMVFLCNEQR